MCIEFYINCKIIATTVILNIVEYWNCNPSLWGDIINWDIFFISKELFYIASDIYIALLRELDKIERGSINSIQYKKALALHIIFKISILIFSDKVICAIQLSDFVI